MNSEYLYDINGSSRFISSENQQSEDFKKFVHDTLNNPLFPRNVTLDKPIPYCIVSSGYNNSFCVTGDPNKKFNICFSNTLGKKYIFNLTNNQLSNPLDVADDDACLNYIDNNDEIKANIQSYKANKINILTITTNQNNIQFIKNNDANDEITIKGNSKNLFKENGLVITVSSGDIIIMMPETFKHKIILISTIDGDISTASDYLFCNPGKIQTTNGKIDLKIDAKYIHAACNAKKISYSGVGMDSMNTEKLSLRSINGNVSINIHDGSNSRLSNL